MKTKITIPKQANAFFLFALAYLLMPSLAHAAGPDFFGSGVTPNDRSVSDLLVPIFGELFGGAAANAGFIAVIKVFNAACMTVGGILAAYTMVFGTMATAHEGEVLGKKWSSAWIPIRTTLGIGLVTPLPSGFCTAQLIIGWVAMQGIGLADTLWSAYINAGVTSQSMAPVTAMPSVKELSKKMLYALTCVEAGNAILAQGDNSSIITSKYGVITVGGVLTGEGGMPFRSYGSTLFPIKCGSVNSISVWQETNGLFGLERVSGADNVGGVHLGATKEERDQAYQALAKAHVAATMNLEKTLLPLAQSIVKKASIGGEDTKVDISILDKAAAKYQADVAQAAGNIFGGDKALDSIKQSATKDGWLLAGAWFMRGAQLQDAVSRASTATPTISAPLNTRTSFLGDSDFYPYYDVLEESLANSSIQYGLQKTDNQNTDGFWDQIQSKIFDSVKDTWASVFSLDSDRNQIMALKSFGDKIMGICEVALVAIGLLMLKFGASSGAMFFGGIIGSLICALFAFGAMISVYYPVLPFIIYFGTALGWLLLVAEAIIAAPLVAVMKLAPAGDDLMGSSRPAYMLLLGLLLRPALIVFGFIVTILAVDSVIRLLNQIFWPMFFSSMSASITGFFTAAVGTGIFFGAVTTLMHKLFGLIHVIPDQLMRWIGGGGEQLGGLARELSESGRGHATAILGNVTRGATQANDAASRVRESAERQKNTTSGNLNSARSLTADLTDTAKNDMEASDKARGDGASTGDMANAVAAKQNNADRHRAASASWTQAADNAPAPQKQEALKNAAEYSNKADMIEKSAENMAGNISKKAGESLEKAQASGKVEDYAKAAEDSKHARDAYNMMAGSQNRERANTSASHADRFQDQATRLDGIVESLGGTKPAAAPAIAAADKGITDEPKGSGSA